MRQSIAVLLLLATSSTEASVIAKCVVGLVLAGLVFTWLHVDRWLDRALRATLRHS